MTRLASRDASAEVMQFDGMMSSLRCRRDQLKPGQQVPCVADPWRRLSIRHQHEAPRLPPPPLLLQLLMRGLRKRRTRTTRDHTQRCMVSVGENVRNNSKNVKSCFWILKKNVEKRTYSFSWTEKRGTIHQGRLNQWAHGALAQGPRILFFLRAPQLAAVK